MNLIAAKIIYLVLFLSPDIIQLLCQRRAEISFTAFCDFFEYIACARAILRFLLGRLTITVPGETTLLAEIGDEVLCGWPSFYDRTRFFCADAIVGKYHRCPMCVDSIDLCVDLVECFEGG